ncbi:MAG: glycosyltransferase family 39 protein [Bryobacterales bacterium]|nr:glycosyltransferase family 39 protein [Bryobacterales bacterium]
MTTRIVPLATVAYGLWGAMAAFYFLLPGSGAVLWAGCLAGSLLAAAFAWLATQRSIAISNPAAWLVGALIVAVLFRTVSYYFYPAPHWSDSRTYFHLTEVLVKTGEYRLDQPNYPWTHTRAYWPPGVVFWFVPWVLAFGAERWVILANNAILTVVCILLLWRIARAHFGATAAVISCVLYAIWANHAFHAMFVSKEYVAQMLLLGAIALLFPSPKFPTRPAAWKCMVSGIFMGFASLCHPGMLAIPGVLVLTFLFRRFSIPMALRIGILMAIGMFGVILPWTARNYHVLGKFVLTNTANGISLLEASSETGGADWAPVPEGIFPPNIDEVDRSAMANNIAVAWIRNNPKTWVKNGILRQLWLLGESSRGARIAMNNYLVVQGWQWPFWRIYSNAQMLVVWALMAATGLAAWRKPHIVTPFFGCCLLILFYFLAIHTVFGSGGRHQLIPGVFAIFLAGAWTQRK